MTPPSRQALVGAGANLGDRAATLRTALERLRHTAGVSYLDASPVYETAPVGVTAQPPFLNLVFGLETTLAPEALLEELQRIEHELGRVRTLRWGPRTIDLDLLAYEAETRTGPRLELPHPRMFERDFVLVPLRVLLRRDPFCRPAWDALRARVGPPGAATAGVRMVAERMTE